MRFWAEDQPGPAAIRSEFRLQQIAGSNYAATDENGHTPADQVPFSINNYWLLRPQTQKRAAWAARLI